MRAVIYTRVSSDPKANSRSVSQQESDCRTICERENWDVAEVLTDNDIGASRHSGKDRPAYKRLAEVLTAGDVLVTWEASRAQRDLKAYVELRDFCADRGVLWSYSGRLYDPTKGDDRFSTGLDALLAEKEAELTRERVLRAKREGALEGRHNGRLPYGYRRVINMRTGATDGWVPDEAEAPIVREIFDRTLDGESLWSISRDFNARGVPVPSTQKNAAKEWKPQRIRVMIIRPTYAGLVVHQEKVVGKGTWEAIATEEEHQRIVAILTDPTRAVHRGCEPRHLLTGIATCGVCGSTVRYFGPESIKTPRYLCEKNACIGRRCDKVDDYVEELIVRMAQHPPNFEPMNASKSPEGRQAFEDAGRLRVELKEYARKAHELGISLETLAEYERSIRAKIEAAEEVARNSARSPLLALLAGPTADTQWVNMTILEKRETIRSMLTISIKKSTVGSRRFTHADIDYLPRPGFTFPPLRIVE
ncbi:recombinase family protein [Rhodococcus globerulus]|uniref:Recombinase family protein n=1 Tax=Rhodococcus globerulus TaxID=33008 RepID=A0ABU4BS25_RHOGO|nr:recombinase family protein [Rhodococcus globerulus]MDV6267025.1 recombinase family protein [Rhodococcus globerulus]